MLEDSQKEKWNKVGFKLTGIFQHDPRNALRRHMESVHRGLYDPNCQACTDTAEKVRYMDLER